MDHAAELRHAQKEPIAVVGVGCRFPGGVDSPESYWELLSAGRDALIDIPRERWQVEKFYDPDLAPGTSRVRRGGFLNCPIDEFDAAFFGISPREADHIDPQQRLLLEVAWEALENAGAPLERLAGSDTGVFIGGFTLDYGQLQFAGVDRSNVAAHTATGVVMTMLANRISHAFDFTGPSLALDTACSSSLVAVHLACHSLWSGESGTALAGGVNLMLTPNFTIAASQGGFLSPTSRSRAFDARADGYVRGEGAGVVVLKRLADALRDGDHVYAVIRGTAVSQDGHTNGITVPNGESQKLAMRHALAEAGVAARSVGYVEAHGTGTPVGDPIEANAIGEVYGAGSGRPAGDPCLIASVKTNIGHLEAAAGAAALIKAVLCLQHRHVPPHLHLTTLNPAIDLTALRLRIPAVSEPIAEHDGVVRAAVNSFGFGGTNAHAVLESAPVPASAATVAAAGGQRPADPLPAIFPVSARSADALAELADRYAEALHSPEQVSVLASATAHRRTHHTQARLAVVTDDPRELREALASVGARQPHPAAHLSAGPAAGPASSPLAFVYTGMGPQWWGMGRELLTRSPVFRTAIERCDTELRRLADWSLTQELLAGEESSRMGQTAISQPANFALQVALTQVWASLGIRPDAIIGHSAGEIAAAYVAGALSFEDAVTVIYHRARLQHQTTGQGRLVAAAISPERALELPSVAAGRVAIAAVNSPVSVALVGQVPDLEEVKAMLDEQDVFCRFVDGAVPFHSPLMDPLEAELRECLAGLAPLAPAIPLYSTVTGCRVTAATHDAGYWWGNVRDPVRFADGALAMIDDGITAFVEVGPHPVLNRSVADCLSARKRHGLAVPSLKRGSDDAATMAHACADLYVAGYEPDWTALHPGGSFQRLPAYPWQRERYWKEADATRRDRLGELEHTFLGTGGDLPLPTWRRYLDGSGPAYLADHRVMDSNLFPGAGYVEMALAAGRSLFGSPRCVAERVRFEAPVIIRPGAAYMLDTTVDKTTGRVAIYGRQPDSRHWVRHASARLAPAAVTRPVLDLDAIRARCDRWQDGSHFYESVRGHGFDYGPAFRPIAGLRLGDGEALGEFRPEALAVSASDDLVLDPVALDGCFQMLLPLISSAVEEHAALLPVGVDRIVVHDRPAGPLWVHASAGRTVGGNLVGDAVLVTDDGRAVIEVRGFHARIVGAEQQVRARLGNRWLHEVTWEAAEPAEPGAGVSVEPGRWLLFADRRGVADRIAGELTAAGHRVVVARPGSAFAIASEDEFLVRPAKRQDIGKVVREVAGRADKPVRGVIYLSPADLDSEATPDAVTAGLKPLLHLVQTLDTVGLAWPLTVITTGAQPADGRLDRAGLRQAPLWGIGRVLHQESLALRSRLFDLDPERPTADIPALVTELLQAEPEEDQVAWRGGERRVARLQPSRRESGSVPVSLRADASYLVTGGLGSLGLLYARWLAERGARRIVLLSRSQLPPRSQWDDLPADHARRPVISAIRDIEELGAIVETVSLDVADPAGLAAFVEQRRAAHLPPVRGIIHSAGAVQDQVMVKMTDDQLDRVLRPKVGGAWALHEAFAAQPLDFFVLFSSVSSVLVTAGQGNYAAANAFLDGLAHYRRARGLPALSINWGPWDAGMIAQLQLQPFYQRRGLDLIPAETGAEIFAELLGSAEIEQVVVSADWPTLVASYPIVPRLIEHLAQADAADAAGGEGAGAASVAERLAAAPAEDHSRVVADCCAEIIGGVLRIRLDSLDRDVPLNQLGLDSMIAVELRIRLEQAFGVAPKMVFLLQGTTVAGVAAYLEDKLVPPSGDTQTADLAALLADLSPEAAEQLLAQVTAPTTKGSDQ